ncbi:MAG: hypothetical protein JJ960_12570 [Kordiimonadaceae bacterium]|nr:hypothetical protein [Kordiimonadaceae bacterium]MBO6569580.1 hypothetical protein [Kordiimonadaceae bacterium]
MNSTDLASKTNTPFERFIEKCFGNWIIRLGGPYCFLLILIGVATLAYVALVLVSRSGAGDPWDPPVPIVASGDSTGQADAQTQACSQSPQPWACGSVRLNENGFLNITFDEAKLNSYLAREQIVILQEYFRKELEKTQETLLSGRQRILDDINNFARAKLRAKAPPAPLNLSSPNSTAIDALLTRSANLSVIQQWLDEFPDMFTPFGSLDEFKSYADLLEKAESAGVADLETVEVQLIEAEAELEIATSKLATSRSEYQTQLAELAATEGNLNVLNAQLSALKASIRAASSPENEGTAKNVAGQQQPSGTKPAVDGNTQAQVKPEPDAAFRQKKQEAKEKRNQINTTANRLTGLNRSLPGLKSIVDTDQATVQQAEKKLTLLSSWKGQLIGVKSAYSSHQADAARYNSLKKALQLQIDSEINLFTNTRAGAPNLSPPLNFSWLYSAGAWWLVHLIYWTTMGVLLDALFRLNQAVAKKDFDPVQFALTVPKLFSAPFMSLLVVSLWGAGLTESGITFVNLPYMMFVFFALGFASNRVTRLVRDATKGVLRGFSLSEDKLRAEYDEARKYRRKYQVNFDLHTAPTTLREVTRQVKAESMQKLEADAIDGGVIEAQAGTAGATAAQPNGAAG